jgi:hypothetical protein
MLRCMDILKIHNYGHIIFFISGECNEQYGDCAKSVSNSQFESNNWWTITTRPMKSYMEIDDGYTDMNFALILILEWQFIQCKQL